MRRASLPSHRLRLVSATNSYLRNYRLALNAHREADQHDFALATGLCDVARSEFSDAYAEACSEGDMDWADTQLDRVTEARKQGSLEFGELALEHL